MALKIINTKSVYFLKGQITEVSKMYFITYFCKCFLDEKIITINIDGVTFIDKKGLQAIFFMLEKAKVLDKKFVIEGYGCNYIYDQYWQKNIA